MRTSLVKEISTSKKLKESKMRKMEMICKYKLQIKNKCLVILSLIIVISFIYHNKIECSRENNREKSPIKTEVTQANFFSAKQVRRANEPIGSNEGDGPSLIEGEGNVTKAVKPGRIFPIDIEELIKMVYCPESGSKGFPIHGSDLKGRRVKRNDYDNSQETEILGMTDDGVRANVSESRSRRVHRELPKKDNILLIESVNPSINETHLKMTKLESDTGEGQEDLPREAVAANVDRTNMGNSHRKARNDPRVITTGKPTVESKRQYKQPQNDLDLSTAPFQTGEPPSSFSSDYTYNGSDLESLDEGQPGGLDGHQVETSPFSNSSQEETELEAGDNSSNEPLAGSNSTQNPKKRAKSAKIVAEQHQSTQIPSPEQSPFKELSSGLAADESVEPATAPQVGDAQVLGEQQSNVYNSYNNAKGASHISDSQLNEIIRDFGLNESRSKAKNANKLNRAYEGSGTSKRRTHKGRFSIPDPEQFPAQDYKFTTNLPNLPIRSNAPYSANLNPSSSTINNNWNSQQESIRQVASSSSQAPLLVNRQDVNSRQQTFVPLEVAQQNIENSFYNTRLPAGSSNRRSPGERYLPALSMTSGQQVSFVPLSQKQTYSLGPQYYRASSAGLAAGNNNHIYARLSPSKAANYLEEGYQLAPQSQILGLIRAAGPPQQGAYNKLVQPQLPLVVAAKRLKSSDSVDQVKLSTMNAPAFVQSQPLQHNNLLPGIQAAPHPLRLANKISSKMVLQDRSARTQANPRIRDNNPNEEQNYQAAATSEPMWSDTQNQEEEYQQSPQTIQITAVPNGGFVGNGFVGNGFNGFNGFNGLNAWNGFGPWNGRQVLLVNKQPGQVGSSGEWRQWLLPVAAVLALPLVLGALFVPVFLKSVMFLIQIFQMLGLLMPPAQLAGHLTSGSHSSSSTVG